MKGLRRAAVSVFPWWSIMRFQVWLSLDIHQKTFSLEIYWNNTCVNFSGDPMKSNNDVCLDRWPVWLSTSLMLVYESNENFFDNFIMMYFFRR